MLNKLQILIQAQNENWLEKVWKKLGKSEKDRTEILRKAQKISEEEINGEIQKQIRGIPGQEKMVVEYYNSFLTIY